jgi:hypothetical protein
MFYACLRVKETGQIIKKEFDTREEARTYIRTVMNDPQEFDKYDQFWTE